MSIFGFLALLLVAAIVGTIGQALVGYSVGGCLLSVVVGFVGAFIGWWLAGVFHLPEPFVVNIDGQQFPIVWSIIGSALLAGILSLFTHRRRLYTI